MNQGHTPQCVKATEAYRRACEEYIIKWPNHCKRCGGWGQQADPYDPASWQDANPCPHCLEKDLCPRCLQPLTQDSWGQSVCSVCDWCTEDGLPEPPECDCFDEEQENWMEDDLYEMEEM